MSSVPPLGQLTYRGAKPALPLFPAVQAALDRVEEHVASAGRDVLLLGPPGVGKTLLLRRLATRPFRAGRVLYCPFLHFAPEEATRWLLALLGLPMDAGEERLVAALMRGGRPWAPNLLLLDEAQAVPEDTLRHLAALLRRADWALSRVWAGIEGSALYRIPRLVDPSMPRVSLMYRRSDLGSGTGLEAIARDLSLAASRRHALEPPAERRPEPPDEFPRPLPRVFDGQASRAIPAEEEGASRPPAAHGPDEPGVGAGRVAPAALPPSPEPAASAVVRRSGLPGRAAFAWRRAWIAAGAAVVAGVVAGLLSMLPRTTVPSEGRALPAVAAAPVLVDINAVPWAHIVVDGREVGATPIGSLSLAPGPHRIQARFGYGELTERTVEVSDENRRVGFRGAPAGQMGQR